MRVRWYIRLGLNLILLPFALGGILAAAWSATWLSHSAALDNVGWNWVLLFLLLLTPGILLGGLIAYGLIVLSIAAVSPNHPLIMAESEERSNRFVLFVWPAFRMVRSGALWLANAIRGMAST
jgi:hypothetical protein